jgi:hypothetical protein
MRSIFEVTVEQNVSDDPEHRLSMQREVFVVGAVNAIIAARKALTQAKRNGYLKSRPLEITKVERIIRDFS